MADCRNCGEYSTYFELNDNGGLCDNCSSSDASCSVCGDEMWLADLNSDGVCFSCSENKKVLCLHCDDEEQADGLDGLCEFCASEGY